jgi:hypothetical protein
MQAYVNKCLKTFEQSCLKKGRACLKVNFLSFFVSTSTDLLFSSKTFRKKNDEIFWRKINFLVLVVVVPGMLFTIDI